MTKPVRITVDLDPDLYKDVKRWALEADAKLADVTRALFRRLLDHPPTAAAIRRDLDQA